MRRSIISLGTLPELDPRAINVGKDDLARIGDKSIPSRPRGGRSPLDIEWKIADHAIILQFKSLRPRRDGESVVASVVVEASPVRDVLQRKDRQRKNRHGESRAVSTSER